MATDCREWQRSPLAWTGHVLRAIDVAAAAPAQRCRVRQLQLHAGWEIDDIAFANISNTPFTALVADPGACGGIAATLDIDNSGHYDALTDGLLVLRYLFGLSGAALTNSALAAGAKRTDPVDVATYMNNIRPLLDVDANGQADALTDGLLLLRYLFGLRGNALIAAAIGPGAARNTAPLVEAYLQSVMP